MRPIDVIVSELCEDVGDTTENKYGSRFLRYVLDAYKELHIFVSDKVDIQSISLDCGIHSATLPCDYVQWTKVGLIDPNTRRIAVLSLDNHLRTYPVDCDSPLPTSDANNTMCGILDGTIIPESGYWFYNVTSNGENLGEIYGLGGGYNPNGYFNVDRQAGRINFSSAIPQGKQLVLEYISTGLHAGLKYIPEEMTEAVRLKAMERFTQYKETNKSVMYREEYRTEYFRLKRLYEEKPYDVIADVMREEARLSIK